jgi:hypothetical protein
MVGQALGHAVFGPIGGKLGGFAGSMIDVITGHGGYKIRSNSIMNGQSIPSFQSGGDGTRVCHREYIADIAGSIAFSDVVYPLNPGISTTFPWLSQIAAQFEEYQMNGLVFEYRPTSGTAVSANSAALGVVNIATNYDALEAPFDNKQQMDSYEYSSSTVPFEPMVHGVECARGLTPLHTMYIRTAAIAATNTDLRFYDMGFTQVATSGLQSAYTVGELWVSYDVTFRKPRLATVAEADTGGAYDHWASSAISTATAPHPEGTSGFSNKSLNPIPSNTSSLNSIKLTQTGYYLVAVVCSGGTLSGNISIGLSSNISYNQYLLANTSSYVAAWTTSYACYTFQCQVTAAGTGPANLMTFTGATGLAGGNTDVFIVGIADPPPPPVSSELSMLPSLPLGGERTISAQEIDMLLQAPHAARVNLARRLLGSPALDTLPFPSPPPLLRSSRVELGEDVDTSAAGVTCGCAVCASPSS